MNNVLDSHLDSAPDDTPREASFREDLESLINRHNIEAGSDTPDFILAEYLHNCLGAFDAAVRTRTQWFSK